MCCFICHFGCDKDNEPSPTDPSNTTTDTIPPAAISDLLARNPAVESIYILWTAPGDDGHEGTADSYDIRYHTETIHEQNWDEATRLSGEPAPKPAGNIEMVQVDGLDPATLYCFAVTSADEEGNVSSLSNTVSMSTLQESTPPNQVTDLRALAIDETSFLLTWTAPGDDGNIGTASQYDIRSSRQEITEATWSSTTVIPNPPIPKSSGEPESLLVSPYRPYYNYYFAIKAADEVPNWSQVPGVAFGLGYNVHMKLWDETVYAGESLRIIFRTPGEQLVKMHLLSYFSSLACDPYHSFVMDRIVPGVYYPQGIHEVFYDFKIDGENFPPSGTYYILLCWGDGVKAQSTVQFEHNP
jgi:hypothetical protein